MYGATIFTDGFTIPSDTVVIVGSGPNGVGNYHKIPEDAYIIACNNAIGIPELQGRFDAWCVVDIRCLEGDKPWFWNNIDTFPGTRLFRSDFPDHLTHRPNTYTMDLELGIGRKEQYHRLEYGRIKMGGSVSGCAMQVGYWFGDYSANQKGFKTPNRDSLVETVRDAYDIVKSHPKLRIIGVDMKGKGYFDGSKGKVPIFKDGTWVNTCKNLGYMVHWMLMDGVDLKSYSETALNVEVI